LPNSVTLFPIESLSMPGQRVSLCLQALDTAACGDHAEWHILHLKKVHYLKTIAWLRIDVLLSNQGDQMSL
jgi:hypothetical protein